LAALLEHKLTVLGELIEGQERFKDFLTAPDWNKFQEMTRPKEALLNNLRQIQAAQDYLLADLARCFEVQKIGTLAALTRLVDPQWGRTLRALSRRVGERVARLQELSRLATALNQAEWRFNRDWLNRCGQALPRANLYNAKGYVHPGSFTYSHVSQQV
jgi:hypothetical protein